MSKSRTRDNWVALAKSLTLPVYGIVDGQKTYAASGETFACVNPATGEALAPVAAFCEADIHAAVKSARRAFEAGTWARESRSNRKRILLALADLIESDGENLALMDSLSMGKPVEIALASDVPGAASFFRWYAESIDKLYDEVVPSDAGSLVTATREPLGVVALITPWNYPIEEAAIKLGPALAAGNSILLKPPELSPYSAIRLGELAIQAGLPPGVLNVVPGLGEVAGKALALHDDVDCVGFTGSTEVGKLLMQYSGQSNMKRVWLECGGKSANIVFADCENLEWAASESARSVLRNQGQVCSAGTRLLVERSILQPFTEALVRAAANFVPTDPLEPASRTGAIASKEQYDKVHNYIAQGVGEGAELLLDGRRKETGQGLYIDPTIFTGVSNDMKIAREEIFGPVICVVPFDSEAEAVRIANDSIYGLVASVWTGDFARAHRLAGRLAAGSVTVNGVDAQSEAAPFGGYKQSGIGREHSLHAFDQYTNLKTSWFHY